MLRVKMLAKLIYSLSPGSPSTSWHGNPEDRKDDEGKVPADLIGADDPGSGHGRKARHRGEGQGHAGRERQTALRTADPRAKNTRSTSGYTG